MPNFDKTGPQGDGPNTGRGMGDCNDNQPNTPTNQRGFGRGLRRGFGGGFGRGLRRGFGPFINRRKVNKEELQEYKEVLKDEISQIDKEIDNTKE